MFYVFDSDSLINLFRYYYLDRFPTLWSRFDALMSEGKIVSVRECFNEVKDYDDRLSGRAKQNPLFFPEPSEEEKDFVKKIFQISDFQTMVKAQARLKGKPVADPFVISAAKCRPGCVITEEVSRPTGAKIPDVCKHFKIQCVDLQQFMKNENWVF